MNHNILILNRFFDVFGISPYPVKNQNYVNELIYTALWPFKNLTKYCYKIPVHYCEVLSMEQSYYLAFFNPCYHGADIHSFSCFNSCCLEFSFAKKRFHLFLFFYYSARIFPQQFVYIANIYDICLESEIRLVLKVGFPRWFRPPFLLLKFRRFHSYYF